MIGLRLIPSGRSAVRRYAVLSVCYRSPYVTFPQRRSYARGRVSLKPERAGCWDSGCSECVPVNLVERLQPPCAIRCSKCARIPFMPTRCALTRPLHSQHRIKNADLIGIASAISMFSHRSPRHTSQSVANTIS